MPLALMSRFFVIRRLASSAELANSKLVCAAGQPGAVDSGDWLPSVSVFYNVSTQKKQKPTTFWHDSGIKSQLNALIFGTAI